MPENNQGHESKQDGGDESKEFIKLKVIGQDSNAIQFRVKMSMKMEKLKKSYSQRMAVPVSLLRFHFDGLRVKNDDTPNQLKMENGDVIEVYQEQIGGARWEV